MQIYPILATSIANKGQNRIKSKSTNVAVPLYNAKNQISFEANYKTHDQRVADRKPDNLIDLFSWHVLGGKQKASREVDREMHQDILNLDASNSRNRQLVEELERTNSAIQSEYAQTLSSQGSIISNLENESASTRASVYSLRQSLESKDELLRQTKNSKAETERLAEELRLRVQSQEEAISGLQTQIRKAGRSSNRKLQQALTTQLEEFKRTSGVEVRKLREDLKKAGEIAGAYEKMSDRTNEKGFGRIAGYEDEIRILLDHVGTPILAEKEGKPAEVPGGVLFFGPKGNGKTTFANAFANHLDCNLVRLSAGLSDEKNLDNLKRIAAQGKELFERTRKRTIILINEFDTFVPKGSLITEHLKDFMDTISSQYHCTVFATTNHPVDIDDTLLRDGRFWKVGLPPANTSNAEAILRHYLKGFAAKNVDYKKLAEAVTSVQPNTAYSNDRIEKILAALTPTKKNLTTNEILQAIKSKAPDIEKVALDLYRSQVRLMSRL